MVRRLLSLLSADVSGVHAAAYLLAFSALASQLLALLRDRLLASTFGAGIELDIYYAAFRIQDFIFFSAASLVSLAILIPVLVGKIEEGKEATRRFLDSIFTVFFAAVAVGGGIAALFAPFLLPAIFPGLYGRGFDGDLLFLSRILLLSPLILGLSNLVASVTQAHRKFFLYALSPVLYNFGIILGIVALYPVFGLRGLGGGVVLGAVLHLAIQLPFILSERIFPRLTLAVEWDSVWRIVKLSLPRTLTLSLGTLSLLVLAGIASTLSPGSISVMSFAFNLGLVPVSIIGASYSVAAFPMLARHYLNKEQALFVEHLRAALKHIIFWSFPALALLITLRAQIVRIILGAGAFTWDDTRLTAAALALVAVSVIAQNITLLFVRAFYAAGETKKPLVITLASAATTITFGFLLPAWFTEHAFFRDFIEALLRVTDVPGAEVLMLPLAFTIGSFVSLALFWIVFRRSLAPYTLSAGAAAFHSLAASVVLSFAAYETLEYAGRIFGLTTVGGVLIQGVLGAAAGLGAWALMLLLLKNAEFREISGALRKRFLRTEVVQTDSLVS